MQKNMDGREITAETFGMIARANGIKSVPCHDVNLMEMIKNDPNKTIGSSIPLLDAWNRGWHKANLAACTGMVK